MDSGRTSNRPSWFQMRSGQRRSKAPETIRTVEHRRIRFVTRHNLLVVLLPLLFQRIAIWAFTTGTRSLSSPNDHCPCNDVMQGFFNRRFHGSSESSGRECILPYQRSSVGHGVNAISRPAFKRASSAILFSITNKNGGNEDDDADYSSTVANDDDDTSQAKDDLSPMAPKIPQQYSAGEQESQAVDITASDPSSGGNVLSCSALVAGTTVGAGIIALPAKTLAAGYFPSALILTLGWLYMATTGLLIAEVNVSTMCMLMEQDQEREGNNPMLALTDGISVNTMARETLGDLGGMASSAAFLFLHYALLTAYVIQGGTLLQELFARDMLPTDNLAAMSDSLQEADAGSLSSTMATGPTLFAAVLGGALFGLEPRKLELFNTLMVLGVIVAFGALLCYGIPQIQPELLLRSNFGAVVDALPLMPVVYVYQTVVPTVCTLLQCDMTKIRRSILTGTAIPLIMFLTWSGVILGSVPYDAVSMKAESVVDPLVALRSSGDALGDTILAFSVLAVATSFVGFAYGLVDFFADVLKWDSPLSGSSSSGPRELLLEGKGTSRDSSLLSSGDIQELLSPVFNEKNRNVISVAHRTRKFVLAALAIVPPVVVATVDPSLFFSALDNAGTYGILVLFGLLPAAMAWSQRYSKESEEELAEKDSGVDGGDSILPDKSLVPGGRTSLVLVAGVASIIIGLETYQKFVPNY